MLKRSSCVVPNVETSDPMLHPLVLGKSAMPVPKPLTRWSYFSNRCGFLSTLQSLGLLCVIAMASGETRVAELSINTVSSTPENFFFSAVLEVKR